MTATTLAAVVYGLTYRPAGLGAVPKGFSIGGAHPSFRWGTITYPAALSAEDRSQYELTEIVPVDAIADEIAQGIGEYAAAYLDPEQVDEQEFVLGIASRMNEARKAGRWATDDREAMAAAVRQKLQAIVEGAS